MTGCWSRMCNGLERICKRGNCDINNGESCSAVEGTVIASDTFSASRALPCVTSFSLLPSEEELEEASRLMDGDDL